MPELIPLYAQIDDATLEAMTSKGIVRRARAHFYLVTKLDEFRSQRFADHACA